VAEVEAGLGDSVLQTGDVGTYGRQLAELRNGVLDFLEIVGHGHHVTRLRGGVRLCRGTQPKHWRS
jgi:hypothetical protein